MFAVLAFYFYTLYMFKRPIYFLGASGRLFQKILKPITKPQVPAESKCSFSDAADLGSTERNNNFLRRI